MKTNYLLINIALLAMMTIGIGFSSCNTTPEPAPILAMEDFFRNPEKASYQISPDGNYFAFTAPYESRMNIFIQKVGEGEAVRITSETERDVAGYFWGNDNRILFLKDSGGDENYKLFGVNIDGSNQLGLTDFEGVLTQIIDPLRDIDSEVIVGMNRRNPQIFDAYRLNIETGELTMIAENPGNIGGWMTDNDGKLRVAFVIDGVNQTILYRDSEQEAFKPIITTNFKETMSPYMFTSDNQKLYAVSNIGRDKSALVIFDPKIGKEEQMLYSNDTYDISGISSSRKDKKLLGAVYYAHDGVKRHFFDDEVKVLYANISKKVSNMPFSISSRNKDEDKMIIRTYSDRSLGAYYLYDSNSDEITHISDIAPWINEENMAHMNCVEYASRDGLRIEAYLTLPKGYTMKNAKNLPVVINPHGGPWAKDDWGYNSEAQFLANRGYAVFQMNFRGSTGLGREFWEASFKEWGKKMQDDITDGVEWLKAQGIADPARVAIYGGSYGGYATLSGLTFTPDLYTCGIDYVGVSNLFTFLETIPPYWKPMLDMLYEQVGDPVADSLLLASASPVFHVDKIKVPLLVVQGANDPRVKQSESDQMVEALRARGVEVEYLLKENEGHGFRNEENRFEFYRAMERFLETHIGGERSEIELKVVEYSGVRITE